MLRAPLPLVSALLLAGLLVGCSSTTVDKTAGWSPNRIHSEAQDEMNSGAYDKAVPLLEKLEGRAALRIGTRATLPTDGHRERPALTAQAQRRAA